MSLKPSFSNTEPHREGARPAAAAEVVAIPLPKHLFVVRRVLEDLCRRIDERRGQLLEQVVSQTSPEAREVGRLLELERTVATAAEVLKTTATAGEQ